MEHGARLRSKCGAHVHPPEPEKKWIEVAAALHQHVISRMLGEEMKGYLRPGAKIVWSRYGETDVYGNLSDNEPLIVGNHSIAPGGFMAVSADGGLTAGFFSRFNGQQLFGSHYLIVKRSAKEMEVHQPDASTTLLSLNCPNEWEDESSVRVYKLEKGLESEVPAAVGDGQVTFLFDAEKNANTYRVRYVPELAGPIAVKAVASQTGGRIGTRWPVTLKISNRGTKSLTDIKVKVDAWKIAASGNVPAPTFKSPATCPDPATIKNLKSGEEISADFELALPASAVVDARYLWIRAQIDLLTERPELES